MSIVDTLVFPDDYTLWDYQRDVVTKTINWALDPDSRRVATASGPTGCGKTFIQMATALEISRRLRADSLLVTRLFEEEDRSSIASLATSQPSAVDPMSLRRTRVLITTTRCNIKDNYHKSLFGERSSLVSEEDEEEASSLSVDSDNNDVLVRLNKPTVTVIKKQLSTDDTKSLDRSVLIIDASCSGRKSYLKHRIRQASVVIATLDWLNVNTWALDSNYFGVWLADECDDGLCGPQKSLLITGPGGRSRVRILGISATPAKFKTRFCPLQKFLWEINYSTLIELPDVFRPLKKRQYLFVWFDNGQRSDQQEDFAHQIRFNAKSQVQFYVTSFLHLTKQRIAAGRADAVAKFPHLPPPASLLNLYHGYTEKGTKMCAPMLPAIKEAEAAGFHVVVAANAYTHMPQYADFGTIRRVVAQASWDRPVLVIDVETQGRGTDIPAYSFIMTLRTTNSEDWMTQFVGRGDRRFGDWPLIIVEPGYNLTPDPLEQLTGHAPHINRFLKYAMCRSIRQMSSELLEEPPLTSVVSSIAPAADPVMISTMIKDESRTIFDPYHPVEDTVVPPDTTMPQPGLSSSSVSSSSSNPQDPLIALASRLRSPAMALQPRNVHSQINPAVTSTFMNSAHTTASSSVAHVSTTGGHNNVGAIHEESVADNMLRNRILLTEWMNTGIYHPTTRTSLPALPAIVFVCEPAYRLYAPAIILNITSASITNTPACPPTSTLTRSSRYRSENQSSASQQHHRRQSATPATRLSMSHVDDDDVVMNDDSGDDENRILLDDVIEFRFDVLYLSGPKESTIIKQGQTIDQIRRRLIHSVTTIYKAVPPMQHVADPEHPSGPQRTDTLPLLYLTNLPRPGCSEQHIPGCRRWKDLFEHADFQDLFRSTVPTIRLLQEWYDLPQAVPRDVFETVAMGEDHNYAGFQHLRSVVDTIVYSRLQDAVLDRRLQSTIATGEWFLRIRQYVQDDHNITRRTYLPAIIRTGLARPQSAGSFTLDEFCQCIAPAYYFAPCRQFVEQELLALDFEHTGSTLTRIPLFQIERDNGHERVYRLNRTILEYMDAVLPTHVKIAYNQAVQQFIQQQEQTYQHHHHGDQLISPVGILKDEESSSTSSTDHDSQMTPHARRSTPRRKCRLEAEKAAKQPPTTSPQADKSVRRALASATAAAVEMRMDITTIDATPVTRANDTLYMAVYQELPFENNNATRAAIPASMPSITSNDQTARGSTVGVPSETPVLLPRTQSAPCQTNQDMASQHHQQQQAFTRHCAEENSSQILIEEEQDDNEKRPTTAPFSLTLLPANQDSNNNRQYHHSVMQAKQATPLPRRRARSKRKRDSENDDESDDGDDSDYTPSHHSDRPGQLQRTLERTSESTMINDVLSMVNESTSNNQFHVSHLRQDHHHATTTGQHSAPSGDSITNRSLDYHDEMDDDHGDGQDGEQRRGGGANKRRKRDGRMLPEFVTLASYSNGSAHSNTNGALDVHGTSSRALFGHFIATTVQYDGTVRQDDSTLEIPSLVDVTDTNAVIDSWDHGVVTSPYLPMLASADNTDHWHLGIGSDARNDEDIDVSRDHRYDTYRMVTQRLNIKPPRRSTNGLPFGIDQNRRPRSTSARNASVPKHPQTLPVDNSVQEHAENDEDRSMSKINILFRLVRNMVTSAFPRDISASEIIDRAIKTYPHMYPVEKDRGRPYRLTLVNLRDKRIPVVSERIARLPIPSTSISHVNLSELVVVAFQREVDKRLHLSGRQEHAPFFYCLQHVQNLAATINNE